MSSENQNILKSLFDIKPVDKTGRVNVAKIYRVQPVVNLVSGNKELGIRDYGVSKGLGNKKNTKKAPTDAASNKLVNSVGAAYSTVVRARQPSLSIAERINKSNTYVDISDSVDGTEFAPVGSWLTNPNRYYTPPTVKQSYQEKLISQDELEKYLNSRINVKRELKAVGAVTSVKSQMQNAKPRIRPIQNSIKYKVLSIKEGETKTSDTGYLIPNTKYEDVGENYETVLRQINEKVTPSRDEVLTGEPKEIYPFELTTSQVRGTCDVRPSPEIESWVRYAKDTRTNTDKERTDTDYKQTYADRLKTIKFARVKLPRLKRLNKSLLTYMLVGLLVFVLFTSFGWYGINLKNEVMKESNSAVANLERADDNLRAFDFESASSNFSEAYQEFSRAGERLNFLGASITSLFAELPGLDKLTAGGAGKLKSAKNLVEAGKLLAEAGRSMSEAVNSLSKTGTLLRSDLVNIRSDLFGELKKSLEIASKNLSKADALLSDVSPDALPEDKRVSFLEFQSKLPGFERIVFDAVGYVSFLENLLGANGTTKKYIVLFQNDSELRPTGGFPGTYAVVTFKDGRLADFLVDDVYNLDGQLKENIIPPKPLQHITPNWGMRDASWFIDFSVSAQKTIEFYEKTTRSACSTSLTCRKVDGVITISPRIILDILKVVGPIEMSEYGFAVNDENFLLTIQAEVEYGDNREQPKQVVKDLAPKLLERINSSGPSRWLEIFNAFVSGLDKKDILMYFNDLNLQSFVVDNGFGGAIKDTDGDYLMITLSNVKGSKTDTVTDNFLKLNSQFTIHNSQPVIKHKLTIMRQHNGGSSRYGFYNKQNPAYVRVLVPEGSELLNIYGNSRPEYKPLISYSGIDFKEDNDLFKLESSFNFDDEIGVDIYNESGKTGFAFWLITDPGKQKTVELEYVVPINHTDSNGQETDQYGIYIQKQPGLEVDNFEFKVGDALLYNGEFDKDLELTPLEALDRKNL
ncbi:MAG: DUF4012 domain-containing protein [Candidatus Yanofskybacteria bacterium]|nr:DUF4012 domain-containing protein [Candidatus Yanofskybacteria bacterium]